MRTPARSKNNVRNFTPPTSFDDSSSKKKKKGNPSPTSLDAASLKNPPAASSKKKKMHKPPAATIAVDSHRAEVVPPDASQAEKKKKKKKNKNKRRRLLYEEGAQPAPTDDDVFEKGEEESKVIVISSDSDEELERAERREAVRRRSTASRRSTLREDLRRRLTAARMKPLGYVPKRRASRRFNRGDTPPRARAGRRVTYRDDSDDDGDMPALVEDDSETDSDEEEEEEDDELAFVHQRKASRRFRRRDTPPRARAGRGVTVFDDEAQDAEEEEEEKEVVNEEEEEEDDVNAAWGCRNLEEAFEKVSSDGTDDGGDDSAGTDADAVTDGGEDWDFSDGGTSTDESGDLSDSDFDPKGVEEEEQESDVEEGEFDLDDFTKKMRVVKPGYKPKRGFCAPTAINPAGSVEGNKRYIFTPSNQVPHEHGSVAELEEIKRKAAHFKTAEMDALVAMVDGLQNSLAQGNKLSERTLQDYEKKFGWSFAKFSKEHLQCEDPFLADFIDVGLWLMHMQEGGSNCAASIQALNTACAGLWDAKFPNAEQERRINPFRHPLIKRLVGTIRQRVQPNPSAKQNDRKEALPPYNVILMVMHAENLYEKFLRDFNDVQGGARNFTRRHLEELRACTAVPWCYTFGPRAKNLINLLREQLNLADLETVGYYPEVEKTFSEARTVNKRMEKRLPKCEWSARLHGLLRQLDHVHKAYVSLRLRPGASPTGRDFWRDFDENAPFQFETRKDMRKAVERVTENMLNPYMFLFEWEEPSDSGNDGVTVTGWLKVALQASGCPEPPPGQKYSSHTIRSGGASAFNCACKRMLATLRWWFGWSVKSDTTDENYIDFAWRLETHPWAKYFFSAFTEDDVEAVSPVSTVPTSRAPGSSRVAQGFAYGDTRAPPRNYEDRVDHNAQQQQPTYAQIRQHARAGGSGSNAGAAPSTGGAGGSGGVSRAPRWITREGKRIFIDPFGDELVGAEAYGAWKQCKWLGLCRWFERV